MSLDADTGSNPRAVMVFTENTLSTNGAMMGPGWLEPLALFAVPVLHQVFEHIIIWKHPIVLPHGLVKLIPAASLK